MNVSHYSTYDIFIVLCVCLSTAKGSTPTSSQLSKARHPDELKHPEEPEHPNKFEDPEIPEHSDKTEHRSKPEQSDKPELPEKPKQSEKNENPDKTEYPNKLEHPEAPKPSSKNKKFTKCHHPLQHCRTLPVTHSEVDKCCYRAKCSLMEHLKKTRKEGKNRCKLKCPCKGKRHCKGKVSMTKAPPNYSVVICEGQSGMLNCRKLQVPAHTVGHVPKHT